MMHNNQFTRRPHWLGLSLLFAGLSLCSCSQEEDISLSTCAEGTIYALDYRPQFFLDSRIWLTEEGGDVGFDEPLSFSTFGLQFLNFEDACEDQYTVSFASYSQGAANNASFIAQNLWVNEYDQVPSGSILDETGPLSSFGTVFNFFPESQLVISQCPPVDAVQFWLNTNREFTGEFNTPYRFEYFPADSTLVITTEPTQVTASSVILSIFNSEEGAWLGYELGLTGGSLNESLRYDEFEPLVVRSSQLLWPAEASSAEVEVRWINNISGQGSIILNGQAAAVEELSVPMPATAGGPFLVTTRWTAGQQYEVARLYEEWPEQISIYSQIEASLVAYSYPRLEVVATGADILVLNGTYSRPEESEFCVRNYTSPLTEGTQVIRFPSFSPRLRNEQLDRIYEGALRQAAVVSFSYYPGMNGSYSWYLRHVHSQQGSGQTWLQSLEYERLLLPL